MIKPFPLIISAMIGGLAVYFFIRPNPLSDIHVGDIKKIQKEIVKLVVVDTSLAHKVRQLRDSVVLHKKRADYWKARYIAPIEVTKQDEFEVFSLDSATITLDIKRGIICDSLQLAHGLEINALEKEVAVLDSSLMVKNKTIHYALKMDSIHFHIESGLQKKIVRRTIGEVLLGIIAILALLF